MKPKSKSTGFKAGLRKVGDFYYYKVKVGGRTHHGSTGCTSRDEAMEWLVSFKKAKKRQTGGFAGIPTVSEVAAEYMEARLDKSDGWKTRLEASMRLWIGPMLGSIRVDRLQLRDITRFKNHYMETPKSNGNPHNIGGLRTLMIDLRSILNYAINARYIHELPFGKLVMPKEWRHFWLRVRIEQQAKYHDDCIAALMNLSFALRACRAAGIDESEILYEVRSSGKHRSQPNALMADIHNRMPVILQDPDIEEWLDPTVQDTARLQRLLQPCDPNGMEAYRVGPVRGDSPELIASVG